MKSLRSNKKFTLAGAIRQSKAGYTLFEIMLVLGIIAVLTGGAIFMLVNQIDIARGIRAEADIQALTSAVRTYEMTTNRLPTTEQGLKALVTKPAGVSGRWTQILKELPEDPWGRPYVYRNPGRKNPKSFEIYSLGASGIEGNEDNIYGK